MEHERQRADRDKYIQVLYKNLYDHRSCYQKAKIQEPDITEDDLCLHYKKALQYNCDCREYIAGVSASGETIKAFSKEFDYDSIMMYNSNDNGKKDYRQVRSVSAGAPEGSLRITARVLSALPIVRVWYQIWITSG